MLNYLNHDELKRTFFQRPKVNEKYAKNWIAWWQWHAWFIEFPFAAFVSYRKLIYFYWKPCACSRKVGGICILNGTTESALWTLDLVYSVKYSSLNVCIFKNGRGNKKPFKATILCYKDCWLRNVTYYPYDTYLACVKKNLACVPCRFCSAFAPTNLQVGQR